MVTAQVDDEVSKYFKHNLFDLAVGKRPEYELFDVAKDPACLDYLAYGPDFTGIRDQMDAVMVQDLKLTEAPVL